MSLKLSDDALSLIARHLQVAILTGTDVVDNLRLLDLEIQGELLVPTKASVETHEAQIQSLLELVEAGFINGEQQIVS